jgi:hypothetical protein
MTAEEHNKTLATLYLIYSGIHGLTLVGLLLLVLVVKFATPAAEVISPAVLAIGSVAFVILFLAVGLLPLLVGYGLRGTALGIYTMKFFRSDAGRALYGGPGTTASEEELKGAMRGAQPLMNWADRLK